MLVFKLHMSKRSGIFRMFSGSLEKTSLFCLALKDVLSPYQITKQLELAESSLFCSFRYEDQMFCYQFHSKHYV